MKMSIIDRRREDLRERGFITVSSGFIAAEHLDDPSDILTGMGLGYRSLISAGYGGVTKSEWEGSDTVWLDLNNDANADGLIWWFHPSQKNKALLFKLGLEFETSQ